MARGRHGGNKGQGSNWISTVTRRRIYARDGWRCVWCGVEVFEYMRLGDREYNKIATLDHVVPRDQGGSNVTSNLITCCMGCNRARGAQSVLRFAFALRAHSQEELQVSEVISLLCDVLSAVTKPLPPASE